jgi:predicted house-cleaning noncanonical NTP pyrophosphatase (MazG superfamily)
MTAEKGKLVRDRIPEIIEANGEVPIYRTLSEAHDFERELIEKIAEETQELVEAERPADLGELADLQEVLDALTKARGYTLAQRHHAQKKKVIERGGFDDRIYLERTK